MQYLLTQEEFSALQNSACAQAQADRAALQHVCTLAARYVPIVRDWGDDRTPRPWGCILDRESSPGYCDACPVSNICPHDAKEWSQ